METKTDYFEPMRTAETPPGFEVCFKCGALVHEIMLQGNAPRNFHYSSAHPLDIMSSHK